MSRRARGTGTARVAARVAVAEMMPAEKPARLTCLAQLLRTMKSVSMMSTLMMQLNPEKFQRLASQRVTTFEYLCALVDELGKLFPLELYTFDAIWNNAMEDPDEDEGGMDADERAVHDLFYIGIPYERLGFNALDWEGGNRGMALMALAARWDGTPVELTDMRKFFDSMEAIAGPLGNSVRGANVRAVKLPSGRAWLAPWDGLNDTLDWLTARTGYSFLDHAEDEYDMLLPPWDIDTIHAMEKQWQEASVIWKRVHTFTEFFEKNVEERLAQLAGALLSDAETMRWITKEAGGR